MISIRIRKIGMLIPVLIFFCSTGIINARANDSAGIIDKVIEAYGGRQNLFSVKSYRLEAVTQALVRGGDGVVTRIFEGPLRLKVLIKYPSSVEIRLLDREKALRGFSAETLVPVDGPLRDSMVLQAARADIPWILDSMKKEISLSKSKDGYFILEAPLGKGMRLTVFVDPKTFLVIRAETASEGEMKLQFAADYSDFRKVDKVIFPFHEENYASGSHTATTKIERIIINPSGADLELPAFK